MQNTPPAYKSLDGRHRAALIHVRKNHNTVFFGQDVRAFRHEVEAAKHNIFGLLATCGQAREFEEIARAIRKSGDFVSLLMIPQDDQT